MKKNFVIFLIYLSTGSNAQPFSSFYFLELPLQCYFTQDNIYFSSYWDNKLIKTDYDGNVVWSKIVAALPQEFRDNYYYGYAYKTDSVILFKCDTAANVIWAKDISATVCPRINNDLNRVMGITVNHNRVFISTIQYTPSSMIDGYSGLLTLDTAGDYINSWCDFSSGYGVGLSHYIVDGYPSVSGAWIKQVSLGLSADESLLRINSDGTIDSTALKIDFTSAPGNQIGNVVQLPDSTFIGFSQGNGMNSGNVCFLRFEESTNVVWKNVFNGIDTSYAFNGGTCDSAGNIYLFSTSYNQFAWPGPFVFMKIDLNGNVISSKGFDQNTPFDVKQMHYRKGKLYLFGEYHINNQVYKGILSTDTTFQPCNFVDFQYTIQATPLQNFSGMVLPIPSLSYFVGNYFYSGNNVDTSASIADLCLALSSNELKNTCCIRLFPNPVQDKIIIEGTNPEKTFLRIFNIVGELVEELILKDGLELDLSNFKPGIYQFEFISGTWREVNKVVKL